MRSTIKQVLNRENGMPADKVAGVVVLSIVGIAIAAVAALVITGIIVLAHLIAGVVVLAGLVLATFLFLVFQNDILTKDVCREAGVDLPRFRSQSGRHARQ